MRSEIELKFMCFLLNISLHSTCIWSVLQDNQPDVFETPDIVEKSDEVDGSSVFIVQYLLFIYSGLHLN